MIKLIACDMDGTLLDSQKRLPEGLLPALQRLREQGVAFAVASGRQYAALRRNVNILLSVPEAEKDQERSRQRSTDLE